MKRLIVAAAVVVLLSVAVGNARGQVQYTVTDLGDLLCGRAGFAMAINSTGQVACTFFSPLDNAGILTW
jgi:hypothetical protein